MDFQGHNNIYFSPSPAKMYSGVKNSDGKVIFTEFANKVVDTAAIDTLYGNFGFFDEKATELSLLMLVSATGDTSGQDRPFKISIAGSSTLPADIYTINPASCVIPHGRMSVYVPITIRRDAALRKKSLFLTVQLESNDVFSTDYFHTLVKTNPNKFKTTLQRTFAVADNIPQPSWWLGDNSFGSYCFGTFSNTKMKMLITDLNIPLGSLLVDQPNISYLLGLAMLYNCHLAKARQAGNPVQDQDDNTGEIFEMEPSDGGGAACE